MANSGGDRELQELAVEELASYQQDLLEIQVCVWICGWVGGWGGAGGTDQLQF